MIVGEVCFISYIRFIGIIMVLISSVALGFYLGSIENLRVFELKEFRRIILCLKGEIMYANFTLPEVIRSIKDKEKGIYKDFLEILDKRLGLYENKRFFVIWEEAVDKGLKATALTMKEKNMIKELGKELEHMDKHTLVSNLDLFLKELEEEIAERSVKAKDRIRIYNAGGILFGVLIVVILA